MISLRTPFLSTRQKSRFHFHRMRFTDFFLFFALVKLFWAFLLLWWLRLFPSSCPVVFLPFSLSLSVSLSFTTRCFPAFACSKSSTAIDSFLEAIRETRGFRFLSETHKMLTVLVHLSKCFGSPLPLFCVYAAHRRCRARLRVHERAAYGMVCCTVRTGKISGISFSSFAFSPFLFISLYVRFNFKHEVIEFPLTCSFSRSFSAVVFLHPATYIFHFSLHARCYRCMLHSCAIYVPTIYAGCIFSANEIVWFSSSLLHVVFLFTGSIACFSVV